MFIGHRKMGKDLGLGISEQEPSVSFGSFR